MICAAAVAAAATGVTVGNGPGSATGATAAEGDGLGSCRRLLMAPLEGVVDLQCARACSLSAEFDLRCLWE
jgi:hypothetical protein